MLTRKQRALLLFIHERITENGVPPSYDEMKDALDLASKSGVHRMILSLEERGFIRRLQRRARALEVLKLPTDSARVHETSSQTLPFRPRQSDYSLPVLGRIAAGVPIEALQNEIGRVTAPFPRAEGRRHFALEVHGDSMIEAGILDGDTVILEHTQDALSGDIVVALIDQKEATLKRLHKKGESVALESENPAHKTRIYGASRVQIQGRLVALVRQYRPH